MTNQGDFSSGDVLTAAELNAFRQVTILQDTISVANGTNVFPTFSTELIDVGGWHASGAASIVAPYDGIYLAIANVVGINSNNRALVNILVNGSNRASLDNNSGGYDLSASAHLELNATDLVTVSLFQSSGGTQTPVVTFSLELVRRT